MAPKIKNKKATTQQTVTSLQETAETIQADAIQYARSMANWPVRGNGLEDLLQRHDFVNYFKFALAERTAATLAAHDQEIQAVYYFDPNLNPDAAAEVFVPLEATVNLLVLVGARSAALESFISALDGALTRQANRLPAPLFASLASILNPILITADDVAQKRGYAVLLSSPFLKPRQVW